MSKVQSLERARESHDTSYGYFKYKDSQFEARKRINVSIMITKEGTFTMISRVVVVRHLGGLLCAVDPMVSLFSLSSLHPWGS